MRCVARHGVPNTNTHIIIQAKACERRQELGKAPSVIAVGMISQVWHEHLQCVGTNCIALHKLWCEHRSDFHLEAEANLFTAPMLHLQLELGQRWQHTRLRQAKGRDGAVTHHTSPS